MVVKPSHTVIAQVAVRRAFGPEDGTSLTKFDSAKHLSVAKIVNNSLLFGVNFGVATGDQVAAHEGRQVRCGQDSWVSHACQKESG